MSSRARKINDGGAITASCTLTTSNPDGSTATTNHACLLVPMDLVTETTPGSGTYDTSTFAPLFPANNGVGMGPSANAGNPKGMFITLSSDLTTTAVDSMTATIGGPSGNFSGTLTETAANSGVFQNSANTVTVTLPVGTTTSSTAIDTLNAVVNSSSLGYNNATFSLVESGDASLYFSSPLVFSEITFSSAYNPSVVNTIQAKLNVQYTYANGEASANAPITVTMTETSAGSETFVDATSGLTVSLTSFTGTGTGSVNSMVASFSGGIVGTTALSTTLTETTATSMDYTSFATTGDSTSNGAGTDITPDNPATTEDGVFYIRIKGMSGPFTLAVQSDVGTAQQVTLTASSTDPDTLLSGKLLIVPQSTNADTSTFTDIKTFLTAGNPATASLFGSLKISYSPTGLPSGSLINYTTYLIQHYDIAGAMYVGMRFFDNEASAANYDTVDTISASAESSFKLKGKFYPQQHMTPDDFQFALPFFNIMYANTHGITLPPGGVVNDTEDDTIPFQGLGIPNGGTDKNGSVVDFYPTTGLAPDGSSYTPINALIPQYAQMGNKYTYSLVFLNACSSADSKPAKAFGGRTYTSQSNAMATAFNCRTYLGWDQEVQIIKTGVAGTMFYQALASNPDKQIQEIVSTLNAGEQVTNPDGSISFPHIGMNVYSYKEDKAQLKVLGDVPPLTASQIVHDPTGNYTGN